MSEETTRPVPTYIDSDGVTCAETLFSPVDNKVRAECVAPTHVVVPVVFVPGIMGSNLKAKDKIRVGRADVVKKNYRVWNVDSLASMRSWLSANPFNGFSKSPAYRQSVLNKRALVVDNRGKIGQGQRRIIAGAGATVAVPTGTTELSKISVDEARKRGWGSTSWQYYGKFLDWLQYQLSQGRLINGQPNGVFEKVMKLVGTSPHGAQAPVAPVTDIQAKKILDIQFPVYAVGYNWLQSNMKSGEDLVKGTGNGEERVLGIEEIIKRHDKINGQSCKEVIVVTHSMGGLVARAAALEYGAKILGIVHGVQPIDGAAAFYKRIAAGFEGEGSGIVGSAIGYVTAKILGPDSRYTIPELAYSPGPLELAPNQLYNGGKPWLFIKDRQGRILKALPEHGDPYQEIYLDTNGSKDPRDWCKHVWRAVNPAWLNPAGATIRPMIEFGRSVGKAEDYHKKLGGRLHSRTYAHWGDDDEYKSWGSMTWAAVAGETYKPSLWAEAASRGMARERWVPSREQNISGPDQWSFQTPVTEAGSERDVLSADNKEIHMTVEDPASAGDGTVPAEASGARIALYPGCQIGCALTGFVHQDDYDNDQVQNVLLDALVRLVEPVKVT